MAKEASKEDQAEEPQTTAANNNEEGENPTTENVPKKKFTKKQMMMAGAGLLLLLICAGAFLVLKGKGSSEEVTEEHAEGEAPAGEAGHEGQIAPAEATPKIDVFYKMEDFLVNLNSSSRQPNFLKMRASLVLNDQTEVAVIEAKMPLIRDNFQVYLRELTVEDLRGSAGIYRLKQELLLRINKVTAPVVVNDILFTEMLVQ